MKVIYKKVMSELLFAAIRQAAKEGKEIEYIELTQKEFSLLKSESPLTNRTGGYLFSGVPLVIEQEW
jgi:hypothetical protein